MVKVRVITAYVNIGLTKRPSAEFHKLGNDLQVACRSDYDRIRCFRDFSFINCWVYKWLWDYTRGAPLVLPAANARAVDRFDTDLEHLRSNIIQHSPMQWLRMAYDEDPTPDVFVWLGYSILKQGDFTGKPITIEHIEGFLERLEQWTPDCIPLPGMAPRGPISVHGDNWRFCGSTLIIPRQFLLQTERSYKANLREFIRKHQCVPLDLAIWPAVEDNSGLPIRWYKAEYDATQLTNFPY